MAYRPHSTVPQWGDPISQRESHLTQAMRRAAQEAGLTFMEIERRAGFFPHWFSTLFSRPRRVRPEEAHQLETVLPYPAQYWLDLQTERHCEFKIPFDYQGNLIYHPAPPRLSNLAPEPQEFWVANFAFNDSLQLQAQYTKARYEIFKSTSDSKQYPMHKAAFREMILRTTVVNGLVHGRWTFQRVGPGQYFGVVYLGTRREPLPLLDQDDVLPTEIVEISPDGPPARSAELQAHYNRHMAHVRKFRKPKSGIVS